MDCIYSNYCKKEHCNVCIARFDAYPHIADAMLTIFTEKWRKDEENKKYQALQA